MEHRQRLQRCEIVDIKREYTVAYLAQQGIVELKEAELISIALTRYLAEFTFRHTIDSLVAFATGGDSSRSNT